MGDQPGREPENTGEYTLALLADVHALERMLESDVFDTGPRRVGAEQEMFLIDDRMRPAPVAMDVLSRLDDERLTNELALFNLEANVTPRVYGGKCLSEMHAELDEVIELSREAAARSRADILLSGILPTLRTSDLSLGNMTPMPRYGQLNDAITRARGGAFRINIKGTDELQIEHNNVMLESANTSFQIHFQVAPSEFAKLYNIAQAVTAPVLSAAVNSPLLLGHRLWEETRVALFQWAVDSRSAAHRQRGLRPRVTFGDDWVKSSALEIFKEQIARFRIFLSTSSNEDPIKALEEGRVPKLTALRFHNGTVYRWNRACYGISDGKPHLRIENRVLPAGPTVLDEMANATFFFGLMSGVLEAHGDIAKAMSFDDAKNNFLAAARLGLKAQFTWVGGKTWTAAELILNQLLPMAHAGLKASGVDPQDADRYLGVIEERVRSGTTGSSWLLRSLSQMGTSAPQDLKERALVASTLEHQKSKKPCHTWPYCQVGETQDWRDSYQTVGRIMSTDLFTVREDDIIDLAANVMDWERIRYMPVEDNDGRLLGILSHRTLLRVFSRRGARADEERRMTVRDIMKTDLVTVSPHTPTLEAMRTMRERKVGCLPVVENERLVGIITEGDLITLSVRLLEKYLQEGAG